MFKIDFETHFYIQPFFEYLQSRRTAPYMTPSNEPDSYDLFFTDNVSLYHNKPFMDRLNDVGDGRIAEMDKYGIDVQILSFSTPSVDGIVSDGQAMMAYAKQTNDVLYQAIQRHPKRFKGFAAIAPYDVPAAIKELERCINELGFVGWLTHSNFGGGHYLDEQQYWPLLEAAERLRIPIYLHPTVPEMKAFATYGFTLAGPPMGFQFDTALCLMRMILGGVFDRFPKLTLILGHLGETMPFLMERLDWAYTNPGVANQAGFIRQRPNIKKLPSEVLRQNVYVTTSGRFFKPVLDYVIQVMGEDRVLFATDYPYETFAETVDFMKTTQLSETVLRKIYFENAKQLGISG